MLGSFIIIISPSTEVEAAWSPADVASVVDWWTVDDVTTDVEGITTLTGREGVMVLSQTTGAAKPQLSGGEIVFDGGDQLSTGISGGSWTAGDLAQPNTIGIRMRWTGGTSFDFVYDGATASKRHVLGWSSTPGIIRISAGTQLNVYTEASSTTNYMTYVSCYNGASSWFRRNGVEEATGDANTWPLNGYKLGNAFENDQGLVGRMVRGAIFSTELSGSDLTDFEAWLDAGGSPSP